MALTEEDLNKILQPVSQLHQRAFQRSLFSLRELGIKPPGDIWQYRVRNGNGIGATKTFHLFEFFCLFLTDDPYTLYCSRILQSLYSK